MKIKQFTSDLMKRGVAIIVALVVTCILCQIAKININQSLGAISCAFCTLMICIFFEERVYHAGSISKALEKMTYMDFIRYFLGIVFDVELLFFFVYGGYVRLSLCVISALVSVIIKLAQNSNKELPTEEE